MKRKLISAILAVAMVATMVVGCGGKGDSGSDSGSDDGKITLKVFSNLPDRKTGQGLVEQTIIDEYMKENENINIEVETLSDDDYKVKFKAYSMEGMPDVVSIWGQPAFLDEVVEAGVLAELDPSDYSDYKFIEGSLNGFTYDGKLYGLPRNTDIAVIYYNKKMFDDNGWKVPTTYDELLALAPEISATGVSPMVIGGGEGWTLSVMMSDLLYQVAGEDCADIISNAVKTGDFSDENIVKAATLLKDAADAGLFQKGFDSQDTATAKNLFTNGQAAMLYIGSWESSMAVDETIDEEIRTNIRMFTMPVVEGGAAAATDIAAWHGGGYGISADSEVKEEAVKFLNYMYQPDKLSKYGWENGVGMSAQDQTEYMTGEESELQMEIVDTLTEATGVSGTPINDCGPSAFKTSIESEIQGLANGSQSVDDFISAIGAACK